MNEPDIDSKRRGRRSFLRGLRSGGLALAALALLAVTGCNDSGEGSSNDKKDEKPLVDLNGTWTLSFDNGAVVAMLIDQNQFSVQGVGQDQNGMPYSFAGTLDDKTLKGTLLPWEAEIKAKVEPTAMGGTFKTSDATGAFTGALQ